MDFMNGGVRGLHFVSDSQIFGEDVLKSFKDFRYRLRNGFLLCGGCHFIVQVNGWDKFLSRHINCQSMGGQEIGSQDGKIDVGYHKVPCVLPALKYQMEADHPVDFEGLSVSRDYVCALVRAEADSFMLGQWHKAFTGPGIYQEIPTGI